MITAADDFPLHQTSRPFRDPGTNRNQYDRFFFCGYPTAPSAANEPHDEMYFAVAFGQYVGRNVCDGAFSIIHQGVQHNVRGSRLLGDDRLNLAVGPLKIDIIEPLRRLKVTVSDPESGISAELTFEASAAPFEEPHYQWAPGNLTVFDITRLTQNGTWSGWIQIGDDRIEVRPAEWCGTRDRSWGIRPIGEREPNQAPDGPPPGFYWLWSPLTFPDMFVMFDVNETATGQRWHQNASISSPGNFDAAAISHGTHTYDIGWRPGTRHANTFDMRLLLGDRSVDISLKARTTFYMQGIGYTHPTWGHGFYKGPDERTYDSMVLADVDETDLAFQHVQILCNAERKENRVDPPASGRGILEMLILGPHQPSALTGWADVRS
jgi:hypothetical protein